MSSPRILIAGLGNVFLGDDAFGVEVVRRLAQRPLPQGVQVLDFGIRGFDLACEMLKGYAAVVLVDATSRGGQPGTLYLVEVEVDSSASRDSAIDSVIDAHSMTAESALPWFRAWGGQVERIWLVGCEPATLGDNQHLVDGLSSPVEKAVSEALELIDELIGRLRVTVNHV